MKTLGLHHVTAIASDAQQNLDFYTQQLGLKLVKLTVNFDDPSTYHLYYGDAQGNPGTVLTFFAWPGAASPDSGMARSLAMQVPRIGPREDPDGLVLDLSPGEARLRGVTLATLMPEETAGMLEFLGFEKAGDSFRTEQSWLRVERREGRPGMGPGTVHHIAFRARDDDELLAWQSALQKNRVPVSSVMDRTYFHSIYFREPGGTLFEIATDPPGFGVEQTAQERAFLERLPALRLTPSPAL